MASKNSVLNHHLLDSLLRVLHITILGVEKKGPRLLTCTDVLWWLLIESLHIRKNRLESSFPNEPLTDTDDARPLLFIQLLLVL